MYWQIANKMGFKKMSLLVPDQEQNQQASIHFLWNGNEDHELCMVLFLHYKFTSAVIRAEYVKDRIPYILIKGHW
jgi:hypothetical protein